MNLQTTLASHYFDPASNCASETFCSTRVQSPLSLNDAVSPLESRVRRSFLRRSLYSTSAHHEANSERDMSTRMSEKRPSRPLSPSRSARSFRSSRHRRGIQSLQNIRFSVFGLRTRPQPNKTNGKEGTDFANRTCQSIEPRCEEDEGHDFQSEHEYYRHLKKKSISPPFNFQHVTHTVSKQLPPSEIADAKDLSARFWAVSASQTPRRYLNGIDARDIARGDSKSSSRLQSIRRPQSLITTSHSRSDSWDLSKVRRRCATPLCFSREGELVDARARGQQASPVIGSMTDSHRLRYPARDSSLASLVQAESPIAVQNELESQCANQLDTQRSDYKFPNHIPQLTRISEGACEKPQDDPERSSWLWLSTQFPQPPTHKRADSFVASPDKPQDRLHDGLRRTRKLASKSESALNICKATARGAYYSRPPKISPNGVASNPELRRPHPKSSASWEDDIDFAYDQELESTCDFDWAENIIEIRKKLLRSTGNESSESLIPGVSITSDSRESLPHVILPPSQTKKRCHRHLQHRTRPSVGHHGFVEARKGAVDYISKACVSKGQVWRVVPDGSGDGTISAMSDNPNFSDHSRSNLRTQHAGSRFGGRECSSDIESIGTRGSKYRRSSSCSSYEGFRQPSPSCSSTPDLLDSWKLSAPEPERNLPERQNDECFLEQGARFLPQDPQGKIMSITRSPRTASDEDATVMRRPQTPGERAVLQAAGNAAKKLQRRPATPNNAPQTTLEMFLTNESPTLRSASVPLWI